MVVNALRRANEDTRIQYALMAVFGGLCVSMAIAPVELSTTMRVGSVGTLFGVTVGLWVSHLIQILDYAAAATTA
jgi:hypothetical protein